MRWEVHFAFNCCSLGDRQWCYTIHRECRHGFFQMCLACQHFNIVIVASKAWGERGLSINYWKQGAQDLLLTADLQGICVLCHERCLLCSAFCSAPYGVDFFFFLPFRLKNVLKTKLGGFGTKKCQHCSMQTSWQSVCTARSAHGAVFFPQSEKQLKKDGFKKEGALELIVPCFSFTVLLWKVDFQRHQSSFGDALPQHCTLPAKKWNNRERFWLQKCKYSSDLWGHSSRFN